MKTIKKIFRYIFPKYSKWVALGKYSNDLDEYVVMIRKNLDNGMLQFKTKKVAYFGSLNYTVDTQKVWDMVTIEQPITLNTDKFFSNYTKDDIEKINKNYNDEVIMELFRNQKMGIVTDEN